MKSGSSPLEDRERALHDVVRYVWLRRETRDGGKKRDYVTTKRGGDINAVSVAEVATRDGLIAHFILAEEKTPTDFSPPKAFLHPSRTRVATQLSKKVPLPRFSN